MKAKLTFLVLTLSATSVLGQTVRDIERRFGKPTPYYSVSKHIWMRPEFSADGQVCQMRFFPKGVNSDKQLHFKELTLVLNRLVPPSTRGLKEPFFGMTATGGGTGWTGYGYKKVTFTFAFSFRVDPEAFRRSEEFIFYGDELEPKPKPENLSPTSNDFLPSEGFPIEVANLKWNARTCKGK